MPIATCFLKNKKADKNTLDVIANEWSTAINVDVKDISITFVQDYYQAGQNYSALVYLYLPSLWSEKSINNIQTELINLLVKHLNISHDRILIITSIVQSGHVVENGGIVTW